MLIKRILTITVEYETNDIDGSAVAQLERNLHYIATNARGNGMFTDDTEAEIDGWEHTVTNGI